MVEPHEEHRDIVPVEARPAPERSRKPGALPRIVAGTINVCINCVQGAQRTVRAPLERRYHRHYHSRHRHGRRHLIADVVFVLAIVTLASVNAYLVFGRARPAPTRVLLAFTPAARTVRVGDPVTWTLAYTHAGSEPFEEVTVSLDLPDAFRLREVIPGTLDRSTATVTLDRLAPGETRTLEIRGGALAPSGTTAAVRATFHGRGATTSERAVARADLTIRGVAVTVSLDTPLIPTRGFVRAPLRVAVEDGANIPSLSILPKPPPGLWVHAATPVRDPWIVGSALWSAERRAFNVELRSATTAGRHIIPIEVQTTDDHGRRVLGIVDLPVIVSEAPFTLAVRKRDADATLSLGGTSTFDVTYTVGVGGRWDRVDLGAQVRGSVIPAIHVTDGKLDRNLNPHWALGALAERAWGARSFTLRLPSDPVFPSMDSAAFEYTPTAAIAFASDGTPSVVVEGPVLHVPIRGALHLAAFGRYFSPEGDQLGRGPLPPRVGKTTKYWVTWNLRSVLEASDRVTVRATLPDGVEWTGSTATTRGEQLIFDPVLRTVTWGVGGLERFEGGDSATASFALAFIPQPAQVGAFAALVHATEVRGVGRATGSTFTATAPPVTTEIPLDQYAQRKGRITAQ